jgi:hypothetical protein
MLGCLQETSGRTIVHINMNIQQLTNKYPDLFVTRPYNYGCGDGWVTKILDPLCAYITFTQEQFTTRRFVFQQIKEKFGTLRLYGYFGDYTPETPPLYPHTPAQEEHLSFEICGAVKFAEALSSRICEITGDAGTNVSVNGWYKTLSENEIKKREDAGAKIFRPKEEDSEAD